MNIFADTSGLFALLVKDDFMHVRAKLNFDYFAENDVALYTSSYVLLETITLLQRRVGLAAVWDFNRKIVPVLEVIWVDAAWHGKAVQRLQIENNRNVSLTDCLSFEIMEEKMMTTAFTFDQHFPERGFALAEFHNLDAR
jgi:uncharacterized protein